MQLQSPAGRKPRYLVLSKREYRSGSIEMGFGKETTPATQALEHYDKYVDKLVKRARRYETQGTEHLASVQHRLNAEFFAKCGEKFQIDNLHACATMAHIHSAMGYTEEALYLRRNDEPLARHNAANQFLMAATRMISYAEICENQRGYSDAAIAYERAYEAVALAIKSFWSADVDPELIKKGKRVAVDYLAKAAENSLRAGEIERAEYLGQRVARIARYLSSVTSADETVEQKI